MIAFNWLRVFYVGFFLTFLFIYPLCYKEKQIYAEDTYDFTLTTVEGEKIHLKDYRGKKIVHLMFWSTWCAKCLMDMPKLKKLWDNIGTKPYEILAINVWLSESRERIKKVQKKYQIPFEIILDEKGKVSKSFGVISVPCHIVIDKEGVIKDRFYEPPEDTSKFFKRFFPG